MWLHIVLTTVEPPNNGQVGTSQFLLYREVVLSLGIKILYNRERISVCPFRRDFFLMC